ncbi:MAG: RHS domain-containing protein [candidate division Zixibacteria bacterium]|nr:RHS domain-containing protein [candidate division Zixibacteria bacterium]
MEEKIVRKIDACYDSDDLYNLNGSVTSVGSPTYVYDKLNRIVKITGITPTDTFAYDAENKRIRSNESGFDFVNIHDIFGNLISQWWVNSPFYFTDYIWANGEPRMRIDTLELLGFGPGEGPSNGGEPPPSGPETRYWFHTDHLGTPYVFTDSNKAVMWRLSTDPFGEVVSELTPPQYDENLRFPGQLLDRSTGLNYNWHRYYQSKIGRYYQWDPISGLVGDPQSANRYAYVGNNPTGFTDWLGLQKDPCRCKTQKSYLRRVVDNFNQTNKPILGFFGVSSFAGFSLRASKVVAAETQGITFGRFVLSGFKGITTGSAVFTSVETGIIALGTQVLSSAVVLVSFETGVLIGSFINAAIDDPCR